MSEVKVVVLRHQPGIDGSDVIKVLGVFDDGKVPLGIEDSSLGTVNCVRVFDNVLNLAGYPGFRIHT